MLKNTGKEILLFVNIQGDGCFVAVTLRACPIWGCT